LVGAADAFHPMTFLYHLCAGDPIYALRCEILYVFEPIAYVKLENDMKITCSCEELDEIHSIETADEQRAVEMDPDLSLAALLDEFIFDPWLRNYFLVSFPLLTFR
jgi:hypothetical protein